MRYIAIPFAPSVGRSDAAADAARKLQSELNGHSAEDYRYLELANHSTVVPGSAGCFGIGKEFPYRVTLSMAVVSVRDDELISAENDVTLASEQAASATYAPTAEGATSPSESYASADGSQNLEAVIPTAESVPVEIDDQVPLKISTAMAVVAPGMSGIATMSEQAIAPEDAEDKLRAFSAAYGKWLLLGVAALIASILFVLLPSFHGGIALPSGTPFYVIRNNAVVRDKPTSIGSNVVTMLARGQEILGIWDAQGGNAKWLNITAGPYKGDFVWGQNVATVAPPNLTRVVNSYMSVSQLSQLRVAPSPTADVIELVHPGLQVYVAGTIDSGWMEILLKRGGVGYLPASALR